MASHRKKHLFAKKDHAAFTHPTKILLHAHFLSTSSLPQRSTLKENHFSGSQGHHEKISAERWKLKRTARAHASASLTCDVGDTFLSPRPQAGDLRSCCASLASLVWLAPRTHGRPAVGSPPTIVAPHSKHEHDTSRQPRRAYKGCATNVVSSTSRIQHGYVVIVISCRYPEETEKISSTEQAVPCSCLYERQSPAFVSSFRI